MYDCRARKRRFDDRPEVKVIRSFVSPACLALLLRPDIQHRLNTARVPAAPLAPAQRHMGWIRQAAHPSPCDNVGNQSLQPTGLSKITIERQERNKGLEDLGLVWYRNVRMTVEHPSDQRGTRARCPKNEEWAPGTSCAASFALLMKSA